MGDSAAGTVLFIACPAFVVGTLLTATIAAAIMFGQRARWERYVRRERDRILAEADRRAEAWGVKYFEQQRAHLEQTYQQHFTGLLQQWKAEEEGKIRRESAARQRAVLKGKIAEQVISLFPGFPYNPADARFIGDPIDYVIFSGSSTVSSGKEDEIEVIFADVKTGNSQLSKRQRCIRDAIQAGRVRWEVLRVDEQGQVNARNG